MLNRTLDLDVSVSESFSTKLQHEKIYAKNLFRYLNCLLQVLQLKNLSDWAVISVSLGIKKEQLY